jgi:hypothetical protein
MTGDGSGHAQMEALKGANLALRFLLELGALVALGDWGGTAGDGRGMKLLLACWGPASRSWSSSSGCSRSPRLVRCTTEEAI